jgi:hypothetical protein
LVYGYFHGDDGAGIGANHQTGLDWARGAADRDLGHLDARSFPERGRAAAFDI